MLWSVKALSGRTEESNRKPQLGQLDSNLETMEMNEERKPVMMAFSNSLRAIIINTYIVPYIGRFSEEKKTEIQRNQWKARKRS
jgi:hypothetical protein